MGGVQINQCVIAGLVPATHASASGELSVVGARSDVSENVSAFPAASWISGTSPKMT